MNPLPKYGSFENIHNFQNMVVNSN